MKLGKETAPRLPNNEAAGYSVPMNTIPAVVIEDEADKRAFARALLKHPETMEGRFAAALTVTGDTGKALIMASRWLNDVTVVDEQRSLVARADEGDLDFIGTKAEFCREILEAARNSWEGETKHKFFKLYAETRGWLGKSGDTNLNVNVQNNRVMVVKDLGSNDDWEQRLYRQQTALTHNA